MSDLVWSDSWVLLAVKYAQGEDSSASEEHVRHAGDYINHAIFTAKGMDPAVSVLGKMELLELNDGRYSLGPRFEELWEASGAGQKRGVHTQLELLKTALGIAS